MNKVIYIGISNSYYTNMKIYDVHESDIYESYIITDNNHLRYIGRDESEFITIDKWREQQLNKLL